MKSPGFLSANVTKPRMAPSWKKRRLGTSWRICYASMFRRICRSTRSNKRWWLSGLTVQRLKATRFKMMQKNGGCCQYWYISCASLHLYISSYCLISKVFRSRVPGLSADRVSRLKQKWTKSWSHRWLGDEDLTHKKHMGWFLVSLGICLGGGIYTNKSVYKYIYICMIMREQIIRWENVPNDEWFFWSLRGHFFSLSNVLRNICHIPGDPFAVKVYIYIYVHQET